MKKYLKEEYSMLPAFVGKDILSFKEASQYLDLSESSLYKLTSDSKITFHKPNGGKLYFKKSDLDKWMLQNESKSVMEIESEILEKSMKNGRNKIQ
jgi:excisionase family DNA binding protein